MVANAAHVLNEGSTLRVTEVSKYFAKLDDAEGTTHALDRVSLSVDPDRWSDPPRDRTLLHVAH